MTELDGSCGERADWYYDDRRQVGLDFNDAQQVASYDERQGNCDNGDERLLQTLALKADHVLADVGCGTGGLVCRAAQACAFVHAIDVSEPMLHAARTRAAALGLANVAFHHASFLTFDVGHEVCDVLATAYALHHLPDFWKSIALVRMGRALKPGGRLFLRDVVFSFRPDRTDRAVEGWLDWMTTRRGYSRREAALHVREEYSTFGWILEGLIERAGFHLIRAQYSMGTYAEYLAEKVGD